MEEEKQEKVLKATHFGKITIGEKVLTCAVLEDGTRILSIESLYNLFNHYKNIEIDNLPNFIKLDNLKPYVYQIHNTNINYLIKYTYNKEILYGYKYELLCIICDLFLQARQDGNLKNKQIFYANLSEKILLEIVKKSFRYFDFNTYKINNVIKPDIKLNSNKNYNNKYKIKRNNYEKQLENYISRNLHLIEDDMKLVKVQYRIDGGIIDILAKDKNNKLCIIELKIDEDSRSLIFQCIYYPTEFKEDCRMIVIAPSYSERILHCFKNLNNVELFTFDNVELNNDGSVNNIIINKYGGI